MTHLSLVAIVLALFVLAHETGSDSFAAMRSGAHQVGPLAASVVFLLALIGFGTKAGVVPLHVWLPRAHPEAPSHVSALMSGAMVKVGVYGVVRVGWDLLGGGPSWWGAVVLVVGLVSAMFGILHALVASDLKRLLAYSTTENVGLIFVGVGAAGLFASSGNRPLADRRLRRGDAARRQPRGIQESVVPRCRIGSVRDRAPATSTASAALPRRMPVTAGNLRHRRVGHRRAAPAQRLRQRVVAVAVTRAQPAVVGRGCRGGDAGRRSRRRARRRPRRSDLREGIRHSVLGLATHRRRPSKRANHHDRCRSDSLLSVESASPWPLRRRCSPSRFNGRFSVARGLRGRHRSPPMGCTCNYRESRPGSRLCSLRRHSW